MSNTAVVRPEPMELVPPSRSLVSSFENQWTLAKVYAEAGIFTDIKSAAQAMVKIQAGAEVGVPPNAAMNGIHIIKGKTSMHYSIMGALIRDSRVYDYEVIESNEKRCELEFFGYRRGEWRSLGRSIFDLDQARKAGTQNLDKWAEDMLFARAMSRGARKFCSDIFLGPVYVPEELGAVIDAETGEVLPEQSYPQKTANGADFRDPKPAQEKAQKTASKTPDETPGNGAEPGAEPLGLDAMTNADLKKLFKELIGELSLTQAEYERFEAAKSLAPALKSRENMIAAIEALETHQKTLQPPDSEDADDAEFTPDEGDPFSDIGVDTDTGEVTDLLAHFKTQIGLEEAKVEKDPKRRVEMCVGWRKQAGVTNDPNLWDLADAQSYHAWLVAYQQD